MKVLLLVVLLFCVVCSVNCDSSRQTPWFKFVNYFDVGGASYETPKTVITPYVQNYPYNYPLHIHQPLPPSKPLPPNQVALTQSPTDDSYGRNSPNDNQDTLIDCGAEQFACKSPHQCIPNRQLCDGRVNCVDASDETNCSCISRLHASKICDGYFDCPDGTDEMGCFGCKKDSYSCYYNEDEYIANSRQPECYSGDQECDRLTHCSNHKDQSNCLLLSPKKSSSPNPFVRSTDGFLYIKSGITWYPVCHDLLNWSRTFCEDEQGVRLSDESISTVYESFSYEGNYVSGIKRGDKIIGRVVDKCSVPGIESNAILRVTCPNVCGVRNNFGTKTQTSRVAGGKEAVQGSHPWLVSLHVNGEFICGGTIIEQEWILTSAHCLNRAQSAITKEDYLEIRAGALRQTSFSPDEQAIRVRRAVIHPDYEENALKNDIALLQLHEPLLFNRWVKPICLPTQERVSSETDANWMWEPVNATCLTAGWGGLTSRGPASVENLMEVQLPIVSSCDTSSAKVFCAGHQEGGFDTCKGNSGGSFACKSIRNPEEFYLAGITTSGYNPTKENFICEEPNTFTTFTRISLYIATIEEMKLDHGGNTKNEMFFSENCPGVRCKLNNRCVHAKDGIVDCLNGEDEI